MECPYCGEYIEDVGSISATFSGDWIQVVVECECGYTLTGDMQLELMDNADN